MLDPMYVRQTLKARTQGEKGRHLRPRLVQKIAEGKPPTSTWARIVKVMMMKKRRNNLSRPLVSGIWSSHGPVIMLLSNMITYAYYLMLLGIERQ